MVDLSRMTEEKFEEFLDECDKAGFGSGSMLHVWKNMKQRFGVGPTGNGRSPVWISRLAMILNCGEGVSSSQVAPWQGSYRIDPQNVHEPFANMIDMP